MTNRVVHFEIQAEMPERAAKFYSDVFGWQVKEWAAPGVEIKDENRYWLVTTGPDGEAGINGGILFRKGPTPVVGQGVNAYVCTIGVKNLGEALAMVMKNGGAEAMAKMPVVGMGWLAYCFDTEGNLFGMMQSDTEAK